MIFVDEIRDYGSKGKWCHMWSSDGDIDELNRLASAIGLKRNWLQKSTGVTGEFIHYDLRPSKREQALAKGAIFKPLKQWIKERQQT